jgi:hypothetical protein
MLLMHLERFKPEHLDRIELPEVLDRRTIQVDLYLEGDAYTVFDGDRVVSCSGLIPTVYGLHWWSILGKGAPMLALHKMALRALEVYRETIVATSNFPEGCRWLDMLGFEQVTKIDNYGCDGSSQYLYVRNP